MRSQIYPPNRLFSKLFAMVTTTLLVVADADAVQEQSTPAEHPRVTLELMSDWQHATGEYADASSINFDDRKWATIDLPHSYNAIDGADGGGYYRGAAWYRKQLTVPAELSGKRLWIQFEGVSFTAEVYIDGVLAGAPHQGGFSTFNYDVTKHLTPGSHVIAVKVDNSPALEKKIPPPGGDYTKAGGIYRDVRLIAVNPVHIDLEEVAADTKRAVATPGTYWTTTNISTGSAKLTIKAKLSNQSSEAKRVELIAIMRDLNGSVCLRQATKSTIPPSTTGHTLNLAGVVTRPRLWNGRVDPYLYEASIEVRDQETGELFDAVRQKLGLRTFSVDPQIGFVLNGKPYPLNGVNAHQDQLHKGWARTDQDFRNDIDLILETGATLVRTAHYPANQAFYDYADETGLLVYTEIAINSTTSGGRIPEGDDFLNASRFQMRELVRQNYHHPSIVMWGLYNEIDSSLNSRNVIANLQALTKEEERTLGNLGAAVEPMRRTTAATWGSFDRLASITDTVGFNRYFGWYVAEPVEESLANELDKIRRDHPTALIGIAEYGGGANIGHHEQWDPDRFAVAPDDEANQQWHSETRQAWIHEEWWKAIQSRKYLCYRLVWQMFDSACDGRNEGSQPGINDKGLVTSDRSVKKDAYFFYKANWNDVSRKWANEPTIYIASRRWDDRREETTQLRAYSNLGVPTVVLNGNSMGAMLRVGSCTYFKDLALEEGQNSIEVTASHDGQWHRDRVTWSFRPTGDNKELTEAKLGQVFDVRPVSGKQEVDDSQQE